MSSRLRAYIRQHHLALVCLFLILSGGTAWATHPGGDNTIDSGDIINSQVKAADIGIAAVRTAELGDGEVGSADVANDTGASALTTADVAANTLTGADIDESSLDATPLRTRVAQGGCSPAVAGTGPMVKVGSVCIDKYEASVWSKPNGGTQYGVDGDDYPCSDNGQDCKGKIFARSVFNVTPSRFITWFQAQQALANSGKRLPTNAEWQAAVAGTPEGQCNTSDGVVQATGIFTDCVSDWGAIDMVGNLDEWVADWDEFADECLNWPADFGSDRSCIGDDPPSGRPGALRRGGDFNDAANAGAFSVNALNSPHEGFLSSVGFRGAR